MPKFSLSYAEAPDAIERYLLAYRQGTPVAIGPHYLQPGGPDFIGSPRARITAMAQMPPGSGTWEVAFEEWPEPITT